MNSIREERIDDEKHFMLIGDFECHENESLDIFLKSYAARYDRESQGNTYIIRDDEQILAYYTLKCNAIQMEENTQIISIPSIEIARFAVKSQYQNKGWGRAIFTCYILPKILQIRNLAAVKFIMVFVDEYDVNAIEFYKKFGFIKADDEVQNYIKESYSENCDIMLLKLDGLNEYLDTIKT